ncbi:MAG TPA: translocation/assembly module TamB domain-containing protein [Propylenella sp.]
MMIRSARRFVLLATGLGVIATAALAQAGAERSAFIRFLEGLISTPERQVALTGAEGLFTANPKVERITLSDEDGVWLEIEGAELSWNRAALIRRTLDIRTLSADRVTLHRPPPSGEASEASDGFGGLPIEIALDSFSLPQILLAAPVAGVPAELAAAGSAHITAEALAAELSVYRQDRAGALTADLRLEPRKNVLSADLTLEEPAGGLIAELLNLRGRPEIAVALSGTGPLDQWNARLDARADGTPVLVGDVAITRFGGGYRIAADLAATLETVVPPDYATLVAGESRLAADVELRSDGSLAVDHATLRSGGANFAFSGILSSDLVPARAELSLRLGEAGRTALPFVPAGVSVARLNIAAALDPGAGSPWHAEARATGVEGDFGTIGEILVIAGGAAGNLAEPDLRRTSFDLEGSATSVVLADPALDAAIGRTAKLNGAGAWSAGSPVSFDALQAVLEGVTLDFAGTATAEQLEGTFDVVVADLARFAALAERPLRGGFNGEARGAVRLDGTFDLQVEGEAADLALDIAPLDALLAGRTRLTGGVARDGGLRFDGLVAAGDRAAAELNGTFAAPGLDLSVSARVADLSVVTPRAAGSAEILARLTGTHAAPRVEAQIDGADIVLMGRELSDASARFSGVVAGPATAGAAEISGTLAGAPVRGSAQLAAAAGGARAVDALLLEVGESRVSGSVTIGADGLLSGDLDVVSPDLSKVAPLFLTEANGMLRADVRLDAEGGTQSAAFSGVMTDIAVEGVTVESAEIDGRARNLFAAPQIEGSFSLRNAARGGFTILSATGNATRFGDATAFSLDARLPDGRAVLQGSIARNNGALEIALRDFTYARGGIELALSRPAVIAVADGAARLAEARFGVGGGSVTLAGAAGSSLDLTVGLGGVPAAVLDDFSPALGAEGAISGTVNVSGTAAAPRADFDLTAVNASVAASRDAGLGPLSVGAQGVFGSDVVDLTGRIGGGGGLDLLVAGTAGTAAGAPLDLRVTGSAPLSLGNIRLASRGAALEGALDVDIRISGTAASPQYSGRVTSEGGGFADPETGIVLRNVSLSAGIAGNRIEVERLEAESGDGNVSATGSVGLDPAAGFPIDLQLRVRQARYVDGTLAAARFDADLALTGRFADGPLLQGSVLLERTEVTVPERLPRDSVAVDVEHVAPPSAVEETVAIARQRADGQTVAGGGLRLDLTISAPQRIFIRGRGLDTELGGELRVTGTTASVVTVGAFEMVRGRFDILTQRIALDRGIVTFAGDLDPMLDFSGTTQSGDVTITVIVTGRASDPEIVFSSVPELPQDEVLARLIFQRGIGELSPTQIARLAAAAAELSGGSGGILGQLRRTTGLDDLDIVTDAEGAPSVAAGRYLGENVYLGLQQGTTAGSTRVTIDLDITGDVKARAGMSAEEGSSLGIFFEREY